MRAQIIVLSNFEKLVLDAMISGDSEEAMIREQLETAIVKSRDYSGVGLFTEIEVGANTPRLAKSNRYIEETPKIYLVHPELQAGAGALLWFTDGFVSMLECYSYEGKWPDDESGFSVSA
jgi:predicted transcriptional regulator